MMTRPHSWILPPLLLALTVSALCELTGAESAPATTNRFEPEIQAFERRDATNPPAPGSILFIGSSSIRLWTTLAEDFPRHRVVNRGFGGSTIPEVTRVLGRIALPYRPAQVVLYAGDNDLASGRTVQQVAADFQAFVATLRAGAPEIPVLFISIKPSPSRWHLADKVREANRLIAEFCNRSKGIVFVDLFAPMLGADGQPRAELFVADRLHMGAEGYRLWTRLVGPHLMAPPR